MSFSNEILDEMILVKNFIQEILECLNEISIYDLQSIVVPKSEFFYFKMVNLKNQARYVIERTQERIKFCDELKREVKDLEKIIKSVKHN